jgi:hypothetical protein
VAAAGEYWSALLETLQEFESPILRHADLLKDLSAEAEY